VPVVELQHGSAIVVTSGRGGYRTVPIVPENGGYRRAPVVSGNRVQISAN